MAASDVVCADLRKQVEFLKTQVADVNGPARWYCPACGHETPVLPDDLTRIKIREWLAWGCRAMGRGSGVRAEEVAETVRWVAAVAERLLKELPIGE